MKRRNLLWIVCLILFCSCAFSNDYSIFRKDGLYGIIDENRNVIMEPNYNSISIKTNFTICRKARDVEIYNKSLELLFSDSWVNLTFYTEYEILIKESMSVDTMLLNVKSGSLTKFQRNENYLEEYGYRDGLELVWLKNTKGALYSIVDSEGNILLTDIEQAHSVYTNGMIAVIMRDGKSGFVNQKGEMVIDADFYIEPSDVGPRKYPIIRYLFNENYALVKNNEQKWVQYNIKGKLKELPNNIEPVEYCYENGLVPIINTETKMCGYMNPKFKIIIPFKFEKAEGFVGKYAVVKYNGKDAVIDKKGNIFYSEDLK